jgi:hypothetical protein
MNVIAGWPRMLDPHESHEYVGGGTIFADLEKKNLIKPRVQGKGLTRYDRVELDNALDHWGGFDK